MSNDITPAASEPLELDYPRLGRVARATRESDIEVKINLDGSGKSHISTGVAFFDHMLTAFAVHGNFDIHLVARGDLEVEAHHTVEDTAIVLGQAFAQALGDKRGITRFADAWIPMDETLVQAVVDVSGRPYCVFSGEPEHLKHSTIEGNVSYATVINQHFFETFATHAHINLHVRVLYGRDPHHITEAEFKAVTRALRAAVRLTGSQEIPSTKGAL